MIIPSRQSCSPDPFLDPYTPIPYPFYLFLHHPINSHPLPFSHSIPPPPIDKQTSYQPFSPSPSLPTPISHKCLSPSLPTLTNTYRNLPSFEGSTTGISEPVVLFWKHFPGTGAKSSVMPSLWCLCWRRGGVLEGG